MKDSFDDFIAPNGLELYRIPCFEETGLVTAVFTTRNGGLSDIPYRTLNLGYHVGDVNDRVAGNRSKVCDALGWKLESTVAGEQVHGDRIAVVTKEDIGRGAFNYDDPIPNTDALITNEPGVVLSSFYADCVPVFLFDPVGKVVAIAHAGWKGTLAGIAGKTLKEMERLYGVQPGNCLAAIGPSIGPCCYEVDGSVKQAFEASFSWWETVLKNKQHDRWELNLWETNSMILLNAGVQKENVMLSRICTSCNIEKFFSYRREKITGRMGAFIALK